MSNNTILLADDDNNFRETLAEVLRRQGFNVVTAIHGQEALQKIEDLAATNSAPALCVIDALMPKTSGFDVAQTMRNKYPQIALIMISGVLKSPQQQSDARERLGAKAFFVKPFDVQKFTEAVGMALGHAVTATTTTPTTTTASANPSVSNQNVSSSGSGPVNARDNAREKSQANVVPSNTVKAPLPESGSLTEHSVFRLLWRMAYEQRTGVVEILGGNIRGRVFCYSGRGAMAQCNDPALNIGAELVRQNMLSMSQYTELAQNAQNHRHGLYEQLRIDGVVNDAQIKQTYKSLVPRIVAKLVSATGQFRILSTDAFMNLIVPVPVLLQEALVAGIRQVTEADLAPHMQASWNLVLTPSDTWSALSTKLGEICGSDSMTRAINGRATLGQMIDAAAGAERFLRMRQAFFLIGTGAVQANIGAASSMFTGASSSSNTPSAQSTSNNSSIPPSPVSSVSSASSVPSAPASATSGLPSSFLGTLRSDEEIDRGLIFNEQEQESRKRIQEKYASIQKKSFWEILDVPKDAGDGVIKHAYFRLARDYHLDNFAGQNLGSASKLLEEIFSKISESYSVLSDPNKRAEYEAKIAMEAEGMVSDVGALLAAEADMHKARLLIDRGEMVAAMKLMERVVQVMGQNPEAQAYLIYTSWWGTRDPARASVHVKQLGEILDKTPALKFIQELQVHILIEAGDFRAAKGIISEMLFHDSAHPGAQRLNRLLIRRFDEANAKKAQGGLMDKILKR